MHFYFDQKTRALFMSNYRNPRLELSLVPHWVFDNRQEFMHHSSHQSKTSNQMFKSFTGVNSPENAHQNEPSVTMSSFSPRSKGENLN